MREGVTVVRGLTKERDKRPRTERPALTLRSLFRDTRLSQRAEQGRHNLFADLCEREREREKERKEGKELVDVSRTDAFHYRELICESSTEIDENP